MILDPKEITVSAIKSVFAAIPFAGQPLNELFYDYRGRIKQERLNAFSELLIEHFQDSQPVDFTQLNPVEFSDLFEAVILSVVKTGSKDKHLRFRHILINYIENSGMDIDYTETYLELINNLNENAIQILHVYNKNHENFLQNRSDHNDIQDQIDKKISIRDQESQLQKQGYANSTAVAHMEVKILLDQLKLIEKKKKELDRLQHHSFYNITEHEYMYLKQILSAKGLMTDIGVGSIDHVPFQTMRMTEFGIEFINFIIADK